MYDSCYQTPFPIKKSKLLLKHSSQRQDVAVAWGCRESSCEWGHAIHVSRALRGCELDRMVLEPCMLLHIIKLLPDMYVCRVQTC